jgi:hypothetical protein
VFFPDPAGAGNGPKTGFTSYNVGFAKNSLEKQKNPKDRQNTQIFRARFGQNDGSDSKISYGAKMSGCLCRSAIDGCVVRKPSKPDRPGDNAFFA